MAKTNSPLVLGSEPIGRLLTQYAIPAIIAMTASSLYNMADSIFIGHGVGALAISGLALTFPLMNLAAAFGSLVGVGASTLVSVKLGQKDYDGANHILGNVLVLNVLLGVGFTLVFWLLLDPILYFFGASEQTIGYARDYMRIILLGNVITHMYLGLNSVLRSSGFPKMAMYATLSSVIINCVQAISLTGQLIHFSKPTQLLHFRKGIYRLRAEIVQAILSIGLSPFLMNLCSCMIVILINRGLKEHGGDMAIGAYGIVNRIAFLFVMIIMGFNQGMQPIAGYNFGAKLYHRVTEVTRLTMRWAVGVASVGFLLCQLTPEVIIGLFTTDQELIDIASKGLHIVFAVYPIVGFQMVATNFFMSIGMSRKAIFLSLTRQLIFLIPCLILLPPLMGQIGVWISIPVADVMAASVTAFMLIRQFKKFKMERQV